jgi:hypothetical protein
MGSREMRSREGRAEKVQRWRDETAKLFFLGLGVPLLSAPRLRSAFAEQWGTIPLRCSGFLGARESLA